MVGVRLSVVKQIRVSIGDLLDVDAPWSFLSDVYFESGGKKWNTPRLSCFTRPSHSKHPRQRAQPRNFTVLVAGFRKCPFPQNCLKRLARFAMRRMAILVTESNPNSNFLGSSER